MNDSKLFFNVPPLRRREESVILAIAFTKRSLAALPLHLLICKQMDS